LGIEQWSRTFGLGADDCAECVQEVSDGSYILAGMTRSYEAWEQAWLVRTDASGDERWTVRFGGEGWEYGRCVSPTSDTGFIMVGETTSYGAGGQDAYLVYYRPL